MKTKIFISSVQAEFAEEREALHDYTAQGSVQVMVFKDRMEVHNPGQLPLGWTVEKLKTLHTSVPANPLLAEPMYLKGYIERLGTGTADMVRIAQEKGLREPQFQQDEDFRTVVFRPGTHQVPTKHRRSLEPHRGIRR